MSFKEIILEDKQTIDKIIEDYFDAELKLVDKKFGENSHKSIEALYQLSARGGKRVRGSVGKRAYKYFGGNDKNTVDELALILELIHAYFLMIDDIQDESDTRRGGPSAHKLLEKFHKDSNMYGNSTHFGESIAINSAISGSNRAAIIISNSNLPEKTKIDAIRALFENIEVTAHGQFNDIFASGLEIDNLSEEFLINIMLWKSSNYTFVNPLRLGAIFAEQPQKYDDPLNDFAIYLGIIFQMVDDYLGVFGEDAKTGKSSLDDIHEGKRTLLMKTIYENSNDEDKIFIKSVLGNKNASEEDLDRIKQIASNNGALEKYKLKINEYEQKAKNSLSDSSISEEFKQYLLGMCDYIIKRDN